jgi:hypothetical protein
VTSTVKSPLAAARDAEARLERLREAQRTAAASLEAAEDRIEDAEGRLVDCDELEADVLAGDIDAEAVATDRANAERMLEEASLEAARSRAALEGLVGRLEQAERDHVAAQLDRVVERLEMLCDDRDGAIERLRDRHRSAVTEARKLVRSRDKIDELLAEAAPMLEATGRRVMPRDEQEFRCDGWRELVQVITDGPMTPRADAAAREEHQARAAREREERQDAALVENVLQHLMSFGLNGWMSQERLEELPEHLRERAVAAWEEKHRELAAQRAIHDETAARERERLNVFPTCPPAVDEAEAVES